MHEEQPLVLGHRRMAQRREQRGMPRRRVHRGAQRAGPAGDRARPVAARGKTLLQVGAIGLHGGFDAGAHHPGQDLARIGGELQLQQFLPHLLLGAAQKGDVAGEGARPGQHAAAEIEQLVDRRGDRAAMAEIVAEIDDAVAIGEPRGDLIVQAGKALRLAVNRRHRPDPPRPAQPGELVGCRCRGPVHSALRRGLPVLVAGQADSICSTRWVAVISSIRSTAANSRTSRSSAAW